MIVADMLTDWKEKGDNVNNDNLDFFSASRNDCFSKLRGLDLHDFIIALNDFYLTYRENLNLPKNVTFGIEIEYKKKGLSYNDVENNLARLVNNAWILKGDGSLVYGSEITSPIMRDKVEYWKQLRKVCKFLKSKEVDTSKNAGGHIHIGSQVLGKNWNAWRQFLKFYAVYESIFFRFAYNDKLNGRDGLKTYAWPIADEIRENLGSISKEYWYEELESYFAKERRRAINFLNVDFYCLDEYECKNTLEFRSPNGCVEEVIWQNNINCIAKMLLSPSRGKIDEDYLDYKLKKEPISPKYNWVNYNEISLKMALEFVDMVFDNNLDKVYFLRQYLKDFEVTHSEEIVFSKKFVK